MPDAVSRPPYIPGDVFTPERDITHAHFRPGDKVVVLKGVAGKELWGDAYKVVTPSWHTPTDEDGWRLYDPNGGDRTYITAHPRYLVHLSRRCPDCLIYLRALEDYLLPQFPDSNAAVDCGWYSLTLLNQLVHVYDARGDR
ncbi:hypothetical protein [Streptomyces sp. NPDC057579]|uniref:hypothetical protein n=1 Tax=Streptomyces sp. NPDC057579 TaxID=3346172 RepID=UPI003684321A